MPDRAWTGQVTKFVMAFVRDVVVDEGLLSAGSAAVMAMRRDSLRRSAFNAELFMVEVVMIPMRKIEKSMICNSIT